VAVHGEKAGITGWTPVKFVCNQQSLQRGVAGVNERLSGHVRMRQAFLLTIQLEITK
jgi:hypothetical protein